MYPGWEGDRRYTVADLQAVAAKYSKLPMTWRDELGEYVRAFRRVMQTLMNKGTVGSSERDHIFLEGLPSQIQQQTRTRLLIKFPDHHPQDPYPFADVNAAALFLLPESPPPLQSASAPINAQLASLLPKTAQTPSQGVVTKREYSRPSPAATDMSCIFCGGNDHFIGRCQERAKYLEEGKCKLDDTNKLVQLDGSRIFGRERTLREKVDRFNKEHPPPQSVQAGLFYRASPEVDCVLEIDPSAFVHTVVDSESDLDEDECTLENAKQALAFAKAKVDQKQSAKDSAKAKSVRFDGIDVPSEQRARPGPASRQTTVEEELISPEVRTSSSKGKSLEVAKITTPAADAPITGAKSSSSSSVSKPANTPSPAASASTPAPSGAYRLSCPLEDKSAEKRITDQILDVTLPVPIRDILAVSPDIRKSMRDLSSNKRITVGTVSVNELSSHPVTNHWMRQYEDARMRSDDGRIVADHFAPLRCIHATTIGGRIFTCVLDQGAEVVVMPKEIWQSLGVGLCSDHRLNMESVNTSRNSTLGVIENIPLDFGGGPMFFQVQVTERANFEILLGRLFFTLTSCRTFDLPNGNQDILITDPNSHRELRIPTQSWVKNCQTATHGAPCTETTHNHARVNASQVESQGF
jgi:hypothetical protein